MTVPPLLGQLRLSDDDLAALCHNGYVGGEQHRDGIIYKLRFRVAGVHRVRSLGRDPVRAREIEHALQAWQRPRREELKVRQLTKRVRRLLRESKLQLEPLLAAQGFKFHGRTIRRSRRAVRLDRKIVQ